MVSEVEKAYVTLSFFCFFVRSSSTFDLPINVNLIDELILVGNRIHKIKPSLISFFVTTEL